MTDQQPLLVDLKEAGRLLGGIGQTSIYKLLNQRELQAVKVGRSTKVELAGILAFIDRNRIGGNPRGAR